MKNLLIMLAIYASYIEQSYATFTEEELDQFAAMNLCSHFRGQCRSECRFYFVHRYGIPLCPNRAHNCCTLDSYEVASSASDNSEEMESTRGNSDESDSVTTTITSTMEPTSASSTTTTEAEDFDLEQLMDDQAQPSSLESAVTPSRCGIRQPIHRRKRIVGGSSAPRGSWPWLVALRSVLGPHVCSGTLVAPQWVVTAAHCFRQYQSPLMYRVRVGEYNLLERDPEERDFAVEEIIIHPRYGERRQGVNESALTDYERYSHDIALIRLVEPADVTPICLPVAEAENWQLPANEGNRDALTAVEQKGDCWMAGWGSTNDNSQAKVLRHLHETVHDSQHCGTRWRQHIGHDMICFGDGTSGSCGGDSGGPLSCRHEGRYYLTGVVSWGSQDCNRNGYPSVLIRVIPYMSWIEQNLA